MNLIAVTTHVATVHILGLGLFITQPADTTAKVAGIPPSEYALVMPNVPPRVLLQDPTPIAIARSAPNASPLKTPAPPSSPRSAPQPEDRVPAKVATASNLSVETHIPFLIFQARDLVDVSGWEVKRFESGYLGIQLNGEHLNFVADGVNQAVNSNLALGHVGGQLRPEYQPPAFSDAAAVFMIPVGDLRACGNVTGNPPIVGPLTRIDTELRLNNNGTFTIQAGTKRLTVDGDATVVAADVPFAYADHHGLSHTGAAHYTFYCAMTGTSGACSAPMPSLSASNQILPCHDSSMVMTGDPASRMELPTIPSGLNLLMDFACSNSQWP